MTWLKVDDSIYDHPKFDNVSLRAVGLWMFAGAYCARHLTDGLIGLRAVVRLGGSEQIAQELISAGLWVIDGDGYRFHDWHDHQPSRDEIHERRKASAERVRKHREQRKSKPSAPLPDDDVTRYNGVTERVTNASCNATPDPTRPDHLLRAWRARSRQPLHPTYFPSPTRCGSGQRARRQRWTSTTKPRNYSTGLEPTARRTPTG